MFAVPVVSAILLNAQGEVLLQLRDDKPGLEFPGCWTLPGGMVEPDEMPDEGIRRELAEEMELDLPLQHIGEHDAPRGPGGFMIVRQHIYRGRLDTLAEHIPLHEGQALRFFSHDQLEGIQIAFDHRETLEKFYRIVEQSDD